jgi:hypothetical protein
VIQQCDWSCVGDRVLLILVPNIGGATGGVAETEFMLLPNSGVGTAFVLPNSGADGRLVDAGFVVVVVVVVVLPVAPVLVFPTPPNMCAKLILLYRGIYPNGNHLL